jgi:hypothetical protein
LYCNQRGGNVADPQKQVTMNLSKKTNKALRDNNFFLSCGGGDFGRTFWLENHNKVVGFTVSNSVRRKEVSRAEYLAQNPGTELTGVFNEFGHENAVTVWPVFHAVRVYSAKQVAFYVKKGF